MDDEALAVPLHREALRALTRINVLSFTAESLWRPIREFARRAQRHIRVLDIATGGGGVLMELAYFARRDNVPIDYAGCDKSEVALEFARERAKAFGAPIEFFKLDILSDSIPSGYDVVINSLFLHHFDPAGVVSILSKMSAAKLLVVSDLRRSRMGLLLAHLAGRILSRSPVVRVDGPRSVRAAYTIPEMTRMAGDAGLTGARIVRRWPCRMLLEWKR